MDNDIRSWLVGVPFNTDGAEAVRERPALSRRQKRELASFTGLVMASTVFFLTPLLVTSPSDTPQAPQLAHTPVTIFPPIVTTPTFAAVSIRGAAARPSARASDVRRATPLIPERTAGGAIAVRTTAGVKAAPRDAASGRRKGLSGGLIRALVGSGRYRVQPFPTPASGD